MSRQKHKKDLKQDWSLIIKKIFHFNNLHTLSNYFLRTPSLNLFLIIQIPESRGDLGVEATMPGGEIVYQKEIIK